MRHVSNAKRVDTTATAISVLPTKSGLGVSGVGNQNTIRPQIRTQLFRGHESKQLCTTQDSSRFTPILPESSAYRGVPQQMGLVESRPSSYDQLSSHELRRPLSPDLSDASDSELELNRLPATPPAAAAALSRQQSIASHASHTSSISPCTGKSS